MKTDDLVALLSTDLEPVECRSIVRALCFALGGGSIMALGIAFFSLGFCSDFTTTRALIVLTLKLALAIGVVALAMVYLTRLARPGGERKIPPFLIVVPFLVLGFLAVISLGTPRAHWDTMIVGDDWLQCLFSIPIIAIVPFAGSVWALRKGAPTNLVRAGAFAGLVAGGVSAMAYALHCTDDSLPFIAIWYGGTILLCTLAGAALGPRFLRW
jgi:hypothetical protein